MTSIRDLRIVAGLHIVFGAVCIVNVFASRQVGLSFGLLAIPTGIGLLYLRNGWRTCALVELWFGLIGIPVVGGLALASQRLAVTVLGTEVKSELVVCAMLAVSYGACVWQYRVLTKPLIRAAFASGDTAGAL